MEYFVHLESGRYRFDQHGCAYGACLEPEHFLRRDKNIVPQPRFEVVFQFWQIEIGAAAFFEQRSGVVKEIQAKIEQGRRYGDAVDPHVLFLEVPSPGPDNQRRDLLAQGILFAALRMLEGDRSSHGIAQIDLPIEQVGPGR